jgi:hypothetical protein
MDYVDDVKYPVTCKKALERGIVINAVQCGTDAECTRYWKDIAEKGGGAYVTIPQAGGVRATTTPYDRRLSEINTELAKTTLIFGEARKREEDAKKVALVTSLPAEVAADRAGYLAKENKVASYDLLDAIRAGKLKLETLKVEELPTQMQKMTANDRSAYLGKVVQHRARLLKEALELDRQRLAYIAKELAKNRDSFDSQVLELLRKQASARFRF